MKKTSCLTCKRPYRLFPAFRDGICRECFFAANPVRRCIRCKQPVNLAGDCPGRCQEVQRLTQVQAQLEQLHQEVVYLTRHNEPTRRVLFGHAFGEAGLWDLPILEALTAELTNTVIAEMRSEVETLAGCLSRIHELAQAKLDQQQAAYTYGAVTDPDYCLNTVECLLQDLCCYILDDRACPWDEVGE